MSAIEISGTRDLTFYGNYRDDPRRRICPVCGEPFRASKGWVYHIGDIYFCRWNHQMDWEKAHPDSRKEKARSTTGSWYVQYSEIWKDSKEGCEARVTLCKKKIKRFKENFEFFQKMQDNRQTRCNELALERWKKKLAEAKAELKRWKQKEGAANE